MFHLGTPAWQIVVRCVVVYLVVFAGMRLMGKREMGQMTAFDFVAILLIANAVQTAMVGPDTSLDGGLIGAAVLLGANRGLSALRLQRGAVGRIIEGAPTLLVRNGQFVEGGLRREEITVDDVEEAMREHGIDDLTEVKLAYLEVDGSISIVPASAKVLRSQRRIRQFRKGR